MNKLGFYIENSTVPFIREALALIKPPVILFHAGDRGLLREIRTSLSPDSFIIGRLFVTLDEQVRWLDANDPELSLIHISEPTRLLSISYAVFCLQNKNK